MTPPAAKLPSLALAHPVRGKAPYSTLARWWTGWHREGNHALGDRPRRPRRSPRALPGQFLDVIRRAHRQLGWGVRRLHAI